MGRLLDFDELPQGLHRRLVLRQGGGHDQREVMRDLARGRLERRPGDVEASVRQVGAAGLAPRGEVSQTEVLDDRRLRRVAPSVDTEMELQELAQSDVYWDTIEQIEPDGMADVYDMTVPDTHNFVANSIVVHNSLEQDADVVMFIYREDYYTQRDDWQSANPEQPGRSYPHGIAQVIVAKHRNGPVGTVDLRFQQKTAKFEDLYAREEGR